MKRAILTLLLALSAQNAAGETRAWNFRVLLDGRDIGRHSFQLRPLGEERELRSEARFEVNVLFVNAYRYQHEATERWQGDCLRSLASRTDTNGERETVSAATRGERMLVEKTAGRDEHEGCVMSFAYWNPEILKARRLLNSQSGELVPVTVSREGEETIEVRGRQLVAQRHRITGPQLSIDLWYASGQWVALESPARGGRRLRYQLL